MSELQWLKSSFSEDGGNNCVEVAAMEHNGIAVRESDSPALVITTNQAALRALISGVKTGRFAPTRG